ncbi:2-polyprenyl-3-methyl-6-methoxy-1,4-benzoquinone monooxygenase [Halomonas sp. Bachu 37]|uniref:2-polyprenyl-3-methyl-6-methoxy-1,4-benzoquinone monooxygenase n=1 Tax=Halomonas kashgarensis TaxID=3084920 RepID=UPI0032166B6B
MQRHLSRTDNLIHQFDTVLRTLQPQAVRPDRPSPATADILDEPMDERERRHAQGLMRINHTGEVCAQALYQGQGFTATLPQLRHRMDQAAREELDHLAWCEERLQELGGRPSQLNPLFYVASFGMGAAAGVIGDSLSLGFLAATEEQVGKHLDEHMRDLPQGDHRSRAVLKQIAIDEAHHAQLAREAGGSRFPTVVKWGMGKLAKVMTKSVYRL